MDLYNIISFGGIFVLLLFAWVCSENRRMMNWRVIIWGIVLQFVLAIFVFTIPSGTRVFLFLNDIVVKVLDSASAGTQFLFGRLALAPGATSQQGETSLGFFLAFQALPAIIFFSALMGALYFLKIMPMLIRCFASLFTRLMRISGAESMCASSNIFVGVESALTIRPHISKMTRSELNTILTAGMATIASSVLAMYVAMLRSQFPMIAGHLISASILSAPAAVVMSKIIIPEGERPETLGINIKPEYSKDSNILEAIINGANAGVKLVVGICALLLAFLGIVALLDLFLSGIGSGIGRILGVELHLTLKGIMGVVFYPFTIIIGIPPADAAEISRVIGERIVATEVASYKDLSQLLKDGMLQHPRSAVICTYALCGFAHVASLAIFVGGISALAPTRRGDISLIGP